MKEIKTHDLKEDMIRTTNKNWIIVSNSPFRIMNVVQVFMRTALHILTQRLSLLLLLTKIISPSRMCSLGGVSSNVDRKMKFYVDIQKLPHSISAFYKKKPLEDRGRS